MTKRAFIKGRPDTLRRTDSLGDKNDRGQLKVSAISRERSEILHKRRGALEMGGSRGNERLADFGGRHESK